MPDFTYQNITTTQICPAPILPISSFYHTPSFGYFNPLLQQLVNSHSLLQQQINDMKDHTVRLRAELDSLRAQQINGLLKGRMENESNGQKRKKIFKKDKNCPVGGCSKKYSSRIALNAHLRKCHGHRSSIE